MVRGSGFPLADSADASRARRVLERLRAGIARANDGFLDFGVLVFGAWTVIVSVDLACAREPADPCAPGAASRRILAGVRRPGLTCVQPARLWRRCE